MRLLIKRIDELAEQIEMGLFTKSEAMFRLREMRSEVADRFEEGGDTFMQLIACLIDVNNLALDI